MIGYDQYLQATEEYDNGHFNKAFDVFLQLSNQGNSDAMLHLANMYTLGEGVACDYQKALFWEKKAVESGNKTAWFNLGITYRMIGKIREARHSFETSLNFGDKEAALELAKLYSVSDLENDKVKYYLSIVLNASDSEIYDISREEAESLFNLIA